MITPTILNKLSTEAIELLQMLIATPSFSCQEDKTATLIEQFLQTHHVPSFRKGNNVWAVCQYFDEKKPTILLNSHHDTVKPNNGYTLNPFAPIIKDDTLFGLGSNDAGGSLVALLATFLYFYPQKNQPFNLIFAASAEEEISGLNGIELILPELGNIDLAIVGEPTQMQMAIAEKGLMVLDCTVRGKAGHAARNEGENAFYKALETINWFRTFKFPQTSAMLGDVKMSVTIIQAGSQHNVVPDVCNFTVDVRTTDQYRNAEALAIIEQHVDCEVKPRSLRLNASAIPLEHPLVQRGIALGRTYYASPTTSDQALMPFTTIKIGAGDSARSHTADEYIYLNEVRQAVEIYVQLLDNLTIN